MTLSIGQILKGNKGSYQLLEVLKASTVFKAQSLPINAVRIRPTFTVVKSAFGDQKIALNRERDNYKLDAIASSRYFRRLIDVVEDEKENGDVQSNRISESESESHFYLIFEWMESDLRSVPSSQFRTGSLPKIVAKSVLEALALMQEKFKAIHTDVNPNNIFLSGIREPEPVAKLGDLGNMLVEGYDKIRLQSLETRAPEVWRGLGCWPASDVWSLGVTLAHWLSGTPIFGPKDKMVEGLTEAWCVAKIQRLVGPVEAPVNPDYEDEFLVADHLETTSFIHPDTNLKTRFIKNDTLREELGRLQDPNVPSELIDFIEYLLVVDHLKRPAASEALQHPYLQSTW
ncbi:hypothetical protein EAF04_005617 [Stromatinia cepivora]|nr:hypothetical protein EAF04_005617 [Stromatinia cepivora]